MQAGTLVTDSSSGADKTAISRLTYGLPLPGPSSDGTCSPTSLTPVRFGYNSSVTCSIPLTGDDLADFCT